jgi:probable F420-dependent oxidoreductase
MEFGITVGNFGTFGRHGGAMDQVAIARHAESLGFDSVWVHDHLLMPATIRARYPYNEAGSAGFAYRQDIYDPLAMMAAIAAATGRVRIGTSVLIIPYRNPVLLARMLATLDDLSAGRVILGLGVGWMAEEFEALGLADQFPVRGSVTDEWMRICQALWTRGAPVACEGRFHSFSGLGPSANVQRPHIPLWVGGKGEIAAKRVARYGSGYHTITSTPPQVAQELAIVRAEVERVGRDPAEIVVSMLGPAVIIGGEPSPDGAAAAGNAEQIVSRLKEYEAAGLQHAIIFPAFANRTGENSPARMMEAMDWVAAEVLPRMR